MTTEQAQTFAKNAASHAARLEAIARIDSRVEHLHDCAFSYMHGVPRTFANQFKDESFRQMIELFSEWIEFKRTMGID